MDLSNIEFYKTPKGDIKIDFPDKPSKIYEPEDREFTEAVLEKIGDFYRKSLEDLFDLFKDSKANRRYQEYLMAHRFIRCNFAEYDSRPDIDQNGIFRLEEVSCPLRGRECKLGICRPVFSSDLSEREKEVMKLYYQSYSVDEIANKLFISTETVKKHKCNALQRLKLHSLAEFISYASRNKMYENHE